MSDDLATNEIRDAIDRGDASHLSFLLSQHPHHLQYSSGVGTWLHKAVNRENMEVVKLLIRRGVDVNGVWRIGPNVTLPVGTAIARDNVEIAKFLLEHGANPNHDRQLIGAIAGNKSHSLELVKLLDEYGADLHKEFVNEQAGEMMNALSTAIDWGKEDVADYLRSRGCVMPGQPHQAARPATPKSLDDEIVEFFRNHFGPVRKQSLVEIVPTEPAIAVHVVPASRDRDRVTLFTTGMSSLPMNVGDGDESFALGELFIELPGDWPYQQIDSPEYGWPIHWLRWLAKAPHQHNKTLGPAMIETGAANCTRS